jgi:hypothetical protein
MEDNDNASHYQAYLMKLNSSGTKQWTKQKIVGDGTGCSGGSGQYSVVVASTSEIYLNGANGANNPTGCFEAFTSKYNSSGVLQWSNSLSSSGVDSAESLTVDASGNIYSAGSTAGAIDGNTQIGSNDFFVVKYNSSGTKQWTKQFGSSNSDSLSGVATDSSGNVYVLGSTSGGVDGNTNSGSTDVFIVKYNSSGTKQ